MALLPDHQHDVVDALLGELELTRDAVQKSEQALVVVHIKLM